MHPVGMKLIIVSFVVNWKRIVEKNALKEKPEQLNASDLFASLPPWGIRSLREMLALVIASYDLTLFYEQMLTSAHKKCGTREHPLWCDDSWEIDFERLVTQGIGSLKDTDIALLTIHPGAIAVAHECVREEIMHANIISNVWHELVEQAYENQHQQLMKITGKMNNGLRDNKQFTTAEKTKVAGRTDRFLRMISGEQAIIQQKQRREMAESCTQKVAEEASKACSQCGESLKAGDESCENCKYSVGENYHIEDIFDDFEDMKYFEDNGASLSASSLEKIEAKKALIFGY